MTSRTAAVNGPLQMLIGAAIRAPSGDNTQPWRFAVDSEAQRIEIHLDETRDPSPMNSGQRMARIGIGAALENMMWAAQSLRWTTELEEPTAPALAAVRVVQSPTSPRDVDPAISARVTNRRVYDGRPIPPEVIDELRPQTPERDGVGTLWIHEGDRVKTLAGLMGRSDSLMLCEPSMRRAFLDNIRFDAPSDAEVEEGLSLASLELPAADRLALRAMSWLPNWLVKLAAGRKLAANAERLVASSSGVCLVVEKDGTPRSELLAGRAMERAWLALTRQGLAVQPMMSMAILESVLSRGSAELLASLGREQTEALVDEFRAQVPEIGDGSLAFIMRFGFASAPTARVGRLPVAAVAEAMPLLVS